MKSARNGCCAHCQYVDVAAHLLQAFLVAHAEALFFVNDEEAEVAKLDVL